MWLRLRSLLQTSHDINPSFLLVFFLHCLVLKCLQARYRARVFYTHAGCTLVALNPFHPVPHLYSLDVMKEYHTAPKPQVRGTQCDRSLVRHHIAYVFTHLCLQKLFVGNMHTNSKDAHVKWVTGEWWNKWQESSWDQSDTTHSGPVTLTIFAWTGIQASYLHSGGGGLQECAGPSRTYKSVPRGQWREWSRKGKKFYFCLIFHHLQLMSWKKTGNCWT